MKERKKEFKRKVCNAVIDVLKPYYQEKKFESAVSIEWEGQGRHYIYMQLHFSSKLNELCKIV